ncbi:RHS repeat-associated core domain-containing protein [Pseudomonas peradeniyensis]|nr:RHS repeat-associated core domain-containing protein [Pseudomonas peradeniyensis]
MSERINDLKVPASALLQCDLAGSVLSAHGTAQRMLTYTAYGYLADPVRKGAIGFNGQLLEGDVQGYLLGNGHRLYHLPIMRFASPDALSPFGEGGVNAYLYCDGDPINKLDPSGRVPGFIKKLFNRSNTAPQVATKQPGSLNKPAASGATQQTELTSRPGLQAAVEKVGLTIEDAQEHYDAVTPSAGYDSNFLAAKDFVVNGQTYGITRRGSGVGIVIVDTFMKDRHSNNPEYVMITPNKRPASSPSDTRNRLRT